MFEEAIIKFTQYDEQVDEKLTKTRIFICSESVFEKNKIIRSEKIKITGEFALRLRYPTAVLMHEFKNFRLGFIDGYRFMFTLEIRESGHNFVKAMIERLSAVDDTFYIGWIRSVHQQRADTKSTNNAVIASVDCEFAPQ